MTTDQILAQQEARIATLILMRSQLGLPYPKWTITSSGGISFDLQTQADMAAWSDALVAAGAVTTGSPFPTGQQDVRRIAQILKWEGAEIYLYAPDPKPSTPTQPLDAETVAGLEAVADRVCDERVEEILEGLNGFVDRAHDGTDFNLDKAVGWALDLPEVRTTFGPGADGDAAIELNDGTTLEWVASEKQWSVTVSDDAPAVAS